MGMSTFDILPGFIANRPADEARVAKAEATLGVKFAADYRRALIDYGLIMANGHELTGICNSPRLSVVAVTAKMREIYSALPANAYVIEDACIDGIIVCQDSTGAIYQLVPCGEPERIAGSLLEYLQL